MCLGRWIKHPSKDPYLASKRKCKKERNKIEKRYSEMFRLVITKEYILLCNFELNVNTYLIINIIDFFF